MCVWRQIIMNEKEDEMLGARSQKGVEVIVTMRQETMKMDYYSWAFNCGKTKH